MTTSTTNNPRAVHERRAGFTLIEVIGAFFMMVVILVFISGIFVENGRQRTAATELMRERLSASGALALIGDDLEGAVFLTPPADDQAAAEDRPWRIFAERGGEYGASAIRFVTQNVPRSNAAKHASNWVEVAYFLEENEDGEQVLWRWRGSRPPNVTPRGFPSSQDQGSARIAVGVSTFGIRLLDSEGNWTDDWDSAYQPPNAALPEAAEISLAVNRVPRRDEITENETKIAGLLHYRRVPIAMRPIDVAELIALEKPGEEAGLDCLTISQCLDEVGNDWYTNELSSGCGGDGELCALLQNPAANCWRDVQDDYPEIACGS